MNFEPKKTYYGKILKWNKLFKFIGFLAPSFLFGASVFGFLSLIFESIEFLGFFIIFFAIFLFFESIEHFRREKLLEKLENNDSDNLANFLNFSLIKLFIERDPKNLDSFFYYLIEDNKNLNFIFNRILLSPNEIKEELKNKFNQKENKEEIVTFIKEVIEENIKKENKDIKPENLLIFALCNNPFFKEKMIQIDILKEDIDNLSFWLESLFIKDKKPFLIKGAMGRKWSTGYSINLDNYGINITDKIRSYVELISHKEEVNVLERVLVKSGKSNALIVGNPGSGRKSLVYNFAQKSLFGNSLEELNYKRVIEIDMESLLAKIQNIEEVEFTLDKIFKEAVFAGDIILVINDIHQFAEENPKIGTINITAIISPFLDIPDFKFIAITDYAGLHSKIEKNHSFLNFFEKVEISEVSKKDTLKILQTLVPYYEKKYKVFISYLALREIVEFSERYLPNLFFPEKGINILEETVIYVSSNKEKIVLPKHVDETISRKTDIPVGDLAEKEKEILINLEDLIHKKIINQEEAVKEISTSLRRARSEIKTRKGPMGSFLFLGPTGVGKTETAKALAEIYFGSEKKIIRLDMSEFQNVYDINRLIGGKEESVGILTSKVKESPFSLILLDELEKANPNILNLFLQILDEGHVTDGEGVKIDFKNSIIIATSNAGYQIILDSINNKEKNIKEDLLNYIFKNNIFKPEFINRFDSTVVFHSLTEDNLLKISSLIFESLRINLEKKGINLIIKEEVKKKIVALSYDPKFGAREMRRVIQDKVENKLAEALLKETINRGDTVEIDSENFEIKIK